ncbi:MAG: protein kinase [Anaerolineae bacterium]|nr:protein kinase [Anaerolineae bacterium]
MGNLDGQVVRGYELRERIGEGGFGTVYRAYQPIVDREVAIKAILPQYADNPEFIRRFEVEAQLIARLEHPHIVPLYDYWREPGGAYLVMRWLRGGNLSRTLFRGPWDIKAIARLLDQVAAALAVAHRNRVVHQDIKPANILLDEDSNAYLTDFGIAQDLVKARVASQKPRSFGSPAYMPPEAILREPITPQADIYSLGIVLYELITGKLPFFDPNTTVILRKHVNDPMPPIRCDPPRLAANLDLVIRRATAKSPNARYPDVLGLAADFRRVAYLDPRPATRPPAAIPALPSDDQLDTRPLDTAALADVYEPDNPYKGLRAFEEADAADFFGRAKLVERLLQRLAEPGDRARFLAVVGPSGSGKSSVISAGLTPALRREDIGLDPWFVVRMLPGAQPFVELEQALLRVALDKPPGLLDQLRSDPHGLGRAAAAILPADGAELFLIIDQFEEVFTLVEDERARARFLDSLAAAVTDPHSRLRVVIALRADFYDRPLLYPGFGDLVRARTEVVLPLAPDELVEAVVRPAERAGLRVEPDLLASIVTDLAEQPGALPLLQYTLTELFERRTGSALTLQAYRDSGGVLGALARRADELYTRLDAAHRPAAQQLFLRLVSLGDGDARRRVRWAELLSIAQSERSVMRAVIEFFGERRLLTFDRDPRTREPTVEVAHEALIREWGRLRAWLDASREELLTYRRLATATTEWLDAGRDASYLAAGGRLAQFEALATAAVALNAHEQAYLRESIRLRRRSINRARRFVAGLVVFALVSLALAAFAFDRQRRADHQASVARSRELAVTALTNLAQPDLALLLSLEALAAADTVEAHNSLLTALQAQPYLARLLYGAGGAVRGVALSPDGRTCAAGDQGGAVTVWEVGTGRVLEALAGHAGRVNRVAFSPDGRRLASAGEDGTVRLWDLETGEEAAVLTGHGGAVWGLAFSPDGAIVASGGVDHAVILWDAATGRRVGAPLAAHTDLVYSVAFSPDGARLASASADGAVILWGVATGQIIGRLAGHTNWVFDVAFGPDGTRLASASADNTIILWDAVTGQAAGQLTGHRGWVRSVSFGLEGRLLASGSADGTVILWDTATGQVAGQLAAGRGGAVWSVAASDGPALVSGGAGGAVALWDLAARQPLGHVFAEHGAPVSRVAFHPGGALLASAGKDLSAQDNAVRLWDVETGEERATLAGHGSPVNDMAFSPDGTLLASGGGDGSILLWDISDGRRDAVLKHGSNTVIVVAFSPDGRVLASGGGDGRIVLWDVATGQPTGGPLSGHTGGIERVVFGPDGRTLASAGQDATVILWDLDGGEPLTLTGHAGTVGSVAFSPDGRMLASGDREAAIIVWEAAAGQPITHLAGHTDWVNDLAFSPDGRILVSGSADKTLILWDTATWRPVGQPLLSHGGWVNGVAFSPDGRFVASGDQNGMMMLWDVGPDAWQALACRVANRNLTPDERAQFFLQPRKTCTNLP